MSTFYDTNSWTTTRIDAQKLVELDEAFNREKLSKEQEKTLHEILPFYIKYRNIVKRLTDCHDHIIDYQKREMIKQFLECAIARMLEYKRDIVKLTDSDYEWPDNFMVEMKLTPDDITLTTPAYYTSDRKALLELHEKCIEDLITNANKFEGSKDGLKKEAIKSELQKKVSLRTEIYIRSLMEKKVAVEAEAKRKQTICEAIILIGSSEKWRKAVCRRIQREFDIRRTSKDVDRNKMERAAIIVQKFWRGYRARTMIKQKCQRVEESFAIMIPDLSNHMFLKKDIANLKQKQELQMLATAKHEHIQNEERDKFLKKHGLRIMEDIADEIRNWYLNWYNKLGFFDVFPSSEIGGSILIANGEILTPEEYLERQSNKENKTKDHENRFKEIKKEKFEKGSKALEELLQWGRNYRLNWENREDNDRLDLITEEISYEVQLEVRKIVDDMMKIELKKLNSALKKDNKISNRKLDIQKFKKARRPKQQKKQRSKKDQLTDYEAEVLFKRLVLASVIKKYPKTRLRNWIGDLSYQNHEARDRHPVLGEISRLVMEYCVLPLGSKRIHRLAPLVRSVNISGLPNYGKKFLVHAICTETGATLFDLTPEVLSSEFESKKDLKMLLESVAKLSKLLAPSVIFIDGGHKPWLKKVPPELKFIRPKRLAPMLRKLVKGIKAGDQVLFLTTSTEPHKALKGFVKIHDKIIIVPLTDYNSLYLYYKQLMTKHPDVYHDINVSALARLTVGFPVSCVREALESVLTLERRMTLKSHPLSETEIFETLLTFDKKYKKAYESIRKFAVKTSPAHTRTKILADEKEAKTEKKSKNMNKKR